MSRNSICGRGCLVPRHTRDGHNAKPLLLPIGTLPASFDIIYFEDRVAAIFMGPYCAFFTMDLKSLQIKIPEGNVAWPVIPYMNFYTPGFNLLSFGFVNIQN